MEDRMKNALEGLDGINLTAHSGRADKNIQEDVLEAGDTGVYREIKLIRLENTIGRLWDSS